MSAPGDSRPEALPEIRVTYGSYTLTSGESRGTAYRIAKSILDGLLQVKNVAVSLLIVFSVVILLPLVIRESLRENTIIEPITLPKAFTEMGYSGDVGAYRLWDALEQINRESTTARERTKLQASAQQFEYLPEQGTSIKSVILGIKKFFKFYDTRIAGEFVCINMPCAWGDLALRLRVFHQQVSFIQFDSIGKTPVDEYFKVAALAAMKKIDPFVAASYLSYKNWPESLDIAREIIRTKHQDAKWASNLIGAYHSDMAQDHDTAIEWLDKALKLDPGFSLALLNKGIMFERKGNLVAALEYTEKAIKADPQYARGYARKATLLGKKGDVKEAEKLFAQAIDLRPDDPSLYNDLGIFYRQHGESKKAKEAYEVSLRLNPTFSFANNNLGLILIEEKQYEKAIAHFIVAVENNKSNVRYLLTLGNLYLRLERFEDCLKTYLAVMKLSTNEALILLSLAEAAAGKDKTVAIAAARAFLGISNDAESVAKARALLTQLGQTAGAGG